MGEDEEDLGCGVGTGIRGQTSSMASTARPQVTRGCHHLHLPLRPGL